MTPPRKRQPRPTARPRPTRAHGPYKVTVVAGPSDSGEPVTTAVAPPSETVDLDMGFLASQAALINPARFALADLALKAKPYLLVVGWRCSQWCGKPIRFGDMCVTTSDGFKPWERAHAACLVPRKGSDGEHPDLPADCEALIEAMA